MPKNKMHGKRAVQIDAQNVANKTEQSPSAGSGKNITKKDFDIVWEWHRGNLQGQENRGYYVVRTKKTGENVKSGFRTKTDANEWLSKTIRIANMIRSGKIVKGEDGKWRKA